jgi:hypothetical protein
VPEQQEHGPFIGARHALPFALVIWLALVLVILWRV